MKKLLFIFFTFWFGGLISQNSNCISEIKASGWQTVEQNNVGIGAITTAVYFGNNNQLPSLTYQWYVNSQENNVGGTIVSGATASKYRPSSSTIGIFYYYCVVSGGAGACGLNSNVSNVIRFEVKPISTPTLKG